MNLGLILVKFSTFGDENDVRKNFSIFMYFQAPDLFGLILRPIIEWIV